MSNLQYWQSKIQEKRKQTPRREFVMEICSRTTVNFYKRSEGISRYPFTERVHQISRSYRDFFDRTPLELPVEESGFNQRFIELVSREPLPMMLHYTDSENCSYSDQVQGSKNSYLSTAIIQNCQDILYSLSIKEGSTDVISSLMVWDNSTNVFESVGVVNSQKIFYSARIFNSFELRQCNNMRNSSYCIECNGLEGVKYMYRNKQIDPNEYQSILRNQKGQLYNGFFISADNNEHCSNIEQGVLNYNISNARNAILAGSHEGNTNFYDVFTVGAPFGSDFYGAMGVGSSEQIYCSINIVGSQNIYYSMYMIDCSFCLGCVGLKNKSYYILNKQYTKEEWYEKVDEIFAQMEATPHPDPLLAGEGVNALGAFFPATMNPFYFNDTAAYLIDPSFTKEEVTAAGYLWRDEPIKVDIPADAEVIRSSDLNQFEGFDEQGNRTINVDILKKVIQDEQGNYYRIIPMEYKFLMKYGLPLPRKHWLERMKENFRIN